MQYDEKGLGQRYEYTEFFDDAKVKGCDINCKLVDQDEGGKCSNELIGENVIMEDNESPWSIFASDSINEGYEKKLCI